MQNTTDRKINKKPIEKTEDTRPAGPESYLQTFAEIVTVARGFDLLKVEKRNWLSAIHTSQGSMLVGKDLTGAYPFFLLRSGGRRPLETSDRLNQGHPSDHKEVTQIHRDLTRDFRTGARVCLLVL